MVDQIIVSSKFGLIFFLEEKKVRERQPDVTHSGVKGEIFISFRFLRTDITTLSEIVYYCQAH